MSGAHEQGLFQKQAVTTTLPALLDRALKLPGQAGSHSGVKDNVTPYCLPIYYKIEGVCIIKTPCPSPTCLKHCKGSTAADALMLLLTCLATLLVLQGHLDAVRGTLEDAARRLDGRGAAGPSHACSVLDRHLTGIWGSPHMCAALV